MDILMVIAILVGSFFGWASAFEKAEQKKIQQEKQVEIQHIQIEHVIKKDE